METVIDFQGFSFQYNAQAEPTLHDINLKIRKGEKVLIAGPSGCGKSTLIHCMNGLIPFSYKGEMSGSLTLFGTETRELSLFDISKSVGTVLQDSDGQFIGMTVGEDIAFALENARMDVEEMRARVLRSAEAVGVGRCLSHAPHELSGGQKQRVSLAGVMVDDVQVLLFDEPLANLDPATGKQAIELIDEIHRRTGATVIIVEHRIEDALHCGADRVILMNDGRIAADMTPDELLSSSLLSENGIREPLYVTALKYAGVDLTPAHCPRNIESLRLPDTDREKVRRWFETTPPSEPAMLGEPLLSAKDISFAYPNGKQALSDVSVTVRRGEMLSIVGANGAGKSTFSKLLCGFETQQRGTLTLSGQDLAALSIKERADRIGYVMQNPNQMLSKTKIFDEVALGLVNRGVKPEEIEQRVFAALRVCGLYPFRKWPVSALSYGQKKRVTVASILVLDPEIIILDEPTAGQDFKRYTEIMEFALGLNARGVTIIMITHDMHLMLEYCDRAVVFADGRVIADGSPSDLLTDSDVIARASLRETSLFDLALMSGVSEPRAFVRRFIEYDRRMRG